MEVPKTCNSSALSKEVIISAPPKSPIASVQKHKNNFSIETILSKPSCISVQVPQNNCSLQESDLLGRRIRFPTPPTDSGGGEISNCAMDVQMDEDEEDAASAESDRNSNCE